MHFEMNKYAILRLAANYAEKSNDFFEKVNAKFSKVATKFSKVVAA